MSDGLDIGDKCICQVPELYNAFGEGSHVLSMGMRLTISKCSRVGGLSFLSFEEAPDGTYFLATHFKPMRSLN